MAATATTIITRAKIAFPEMGTTEALALLNDAHAEFLARYPLRQDTLTVPLVEGTREYTLAETAIQIEAAYYYQDALNPRPLNVISQHEEDELGGAWRDQQDGVPSGYYIVGNLTAGVIGLHPTPNDSTLVVSTASSATPILVTTAEAHGFSDGDKVIISDVTSNSAANGEFYVDVQSTTTFTLYSDSDLTEAVAGLGSGTGGYLIGPGWPGVRLYIRRNQTLTGSDTIPPLLLSIEPYVYSVCRRWAEMKYAPSEWQKWQKLENDAVHKMELYLAERQGQSTAILKPAYVRSRRIY